MRGVVAPIDLDASIYVLPLKLSTADLTTLVAIGISVTLSAIMTFCTLPPKSAIRAIASMIDGIDIRPSINRITIMSNFWEYPADIPIIVPPEIAIIATDIPTVREIRLP
jgi:hypothetical protein